MTDCDDTQAQDGEIETACGRFHTNHLFESDPLRYRTERSTLWPKVLWLGVRTRVDTRSADPRCRWVAPWAGVRGGPTP